MSGYQSPIPLFRKDSLKIKQEIDLRGKNNGAEFDPSVKEFIVQDKILLKVGNKIYQLVEYHFHLPGEHKINKTIYPSEIHYVFRELCNNQKEMTPCRKFDICGDDHPKEAGNILVVGRALASCLNYQPKNLTKIQVILPNQYYEYDGALTVGNFDPVKWIVGESPLPLDLKQIIPYAKDARKLQPLNGRIILRSTHQ